MSTHSFIPAIVIGARVVNAYGMHASQQLIAETGDTVGMTEIQDGAGRINTHSFALFKGLPMTRRRIFSVSDA